MAGAAIAGRPSGPRPQMCPRPAARRDPSSVARQSC